MSRDFQRERLYAAERAAAKEMKEPFGSAGGRYDLLQLENWLNKDVLVDSTYELLGVPNQLRRRAYVNEPRKNGVRTSARGWLGLPKYKDGTTYGETGYCMTLPDWSRCRLIALHELAHGFSDDLFKTQALHGPFFCYTYLTLVDAFLGEDWGAELERQYYEHKVIFSKRVETAAATPSPLRYGNFVIKRNVLK